VKNDTIINFKDIVYGDKGRLLKISFEHFDKIVNVFSLYAPNEYSERKLFFERCRQYINPNEINIIGGDFNDYSDTLLDRSRTMTDNVPNNNAYVSFKTQNNLIDIWRDRYPEKRIFSRKQWVNGILKQSRIDAFIISRNSMQHTVNCFYKWSSISDHSYVCAKFDFSDIDRGPGMWIFNNTLLLDEYFCSKINDIINTSLLCPLYTREKLVWWDNLKYKLKSFSKQYATKRHKEEQQKFWTLHNKIQKEYSKIDKGINTNYELIIQLESELKQFEKHKCNGAILRSKAFWAIESDRNTSYFLKLEKYKQENNCIKELYTSDGKIVAETRDIMETEVKFYQNLFSQEQVDHNNQNKLFNLINTKQ